MVDAAVEIKHPRSQTAMPSNKRGSLNNLSSDEIREVVNLERPRIKPDLEELEDVGQNMQRQYISF